MKRHATDDPFADTELRGCCCNSPNREKPQERRRRIGLIIATVFALVVWGALVWVCRGRL